MKEYRQYGYGRVLVDKLEEAAVKAGRDGRAKVEDGQVTIKSHSQVRLPFAVVGIKTTWFSAGIETFRWEITG